MAFKDSFPYLDQWLQYGGTLGVQANLDGLVRVEVGDSEGLAEDYVCESESVDGALVKAEEQVAQLIAEANDLLDMYMSGDVKSPDQEIIRITGVPSMQNPFYKESS